ncbi:MAG: alpha/beta hydrolase-fold protein [Planctomycetaceae bacterium]|nr:alpha/beta hydrolase-fold protein [Planctomycetaceae bacterium]
MPALPLMLLSLFVEPEANFSAGIRTEQGWLSHAVTSPYQMGETEIRVLAPEVIEGQTCPVNYVLPVEAGRESRYGDGLTEILKLPAEMRQRAIYVAPTFSQLPWYADHPTDPRIRQESHFLKAVLPFVERTYPARRDRGGRLLLGFSKSGWGAWSLLLRHPDRFERAAAWDAPLMMSAPGKYGSSPIFGDPATFSGYQISTLLRDRVESLRPHARLIHLGYGNFRSDHVQVESLLEELKIPHTYHDGPQREHIWHTGWIAEGVELLLRP